MLSGMFSARIATLCVASLLTTSAAWAQTAALDSQEPQCRETVAKFEESMAFVRKSVGYQRATEIKESLLPDKLEAEIFNKEGYCGVARYLRAKKLIEKNGR